jgi:hypothetical protein
MPRSSLVKLLPSYSSEIAVGTPCAKHMTTEAQEAAEQIKNFEVRQRRHFHIGGVAPFFLSFQSSAGTGGDV